MISILRSDVKILFPLNHFWWQEKFKKIHSKACSRHLLNIPNFAYTMPDLLVVMISVLLLDGNTGWSSFTKRLPNPGVYTSCCQLRYELYSASHTQSCSQEIWYCNSSYTARSCSAASSCQAAKLLQSGLWCHHPSSAHPARVLRDSTLR